MPCPVVEPRPRPYVPPGCLGDVALEVFVEGRRVAHRPVDVGIAQHPASGFHPTLVPVAVRHGRSPALPVDGGRHGACPMHGLGAVPRIPRRRPVGQRALATAHLETFLAHTARDAASFVSYHRRHRHRMRGLLFEPGPHRPAFTAMWNRDPRITPVAEDVVPDDGRVAQDPESHPGAGAVDHVADDPDADGAHEDSQPVLPAR